MGFPLPPSDGPAVRRLREAPLLAALSAALFAVYRQFPDAFHAFDGLMFSGIVSERTAGWRAALFEYAGHFLYNPTGWLFHKALSAFGPLPGYESLTLLNHLAATAAVLVLLVLLREVTGGLRLALPLALLAAHSHNFWVRASECSVYMLPLVWTALAFWAAWRYHRRPTAAAALALAAAWSLAALYHLQHLFWLPAPLLLLLRRNPRHAALFAGTGAVLVSVPQVLTYGLTSPAAWAAWYLKMGSASQTTWGYRPGVLRMVFPARHLAGVLFRTFWAWPPWRASWPLLACLAAATACLGAAVFLALRAGGRMGVVREADFAVFLAVHVLGTLFFQCISLWSNDLRYAVGLVLPFVLLLGLIAAAAPRRGAAALLWGLWLLTALYNLRADVIPRSRRDLNGDLKSALFIKSRVEPGATILIQGGFHKLYLTGLAGLGIITMDHYLMLYPKEEALARVDEAALGDLSSGTPVYVLSDVLESGAGAGAPDGQRPSAADIRRLLAPFEVREAARFSPGLRVLRLWPRRAGASYWNYAAERALGAGDRRGAAYALAHLRGAGK